MTNEDAWTPELSEVRVRLPYTDGFEKADAEYVAAAIVVTLKESGDPRWRPWQWDEVADRMIKIVDKDDPLRILLNPFINVGRGVDVLLGRDWIVRDGDDFTCSDEFKRRAWLSGHGIVGELRQLFAAIGQAARVER